MRRLLSLKDSKNPPSNTRGKERQQDPTSLSVPLSDSSSSRTPMEVHVSTEVHSAPDRIGIHPITSTTSLISSSPASSDSRPLPPEIRVPTHPYPYWQGHTDTPSSSQSSLESPSYVSWLNPAIPISSSTNTNLGLTSPTFVPQSYPEPSSSNHALVQGRSSPSPHFPPPPPTNPPPNIITRPKLLHPTKSSHSLRAQEFFNQQLSPIVEQDYLSPEKRPVSLPSSSHEGGGSRSSTAHTVSMSIVTPVSPGSDRIGSATVTPVSPVPITPILVGTRGIQTPVTPLFAGGVAPFARRKEEEVNDSPRPSPVSTFILRPLNRSISLSSTRTHQSGSSVTPPIIPPLDLKPEFRGQAFLTTPTSLDSRGLLDIAARDDDSVSDRRESFITARTGAGRESRYSFGQEEVFVDAEDGYRRESDGTIHPFDSRLLEDNDGTPPAPQIPQDTSAPIEPPNPAYTITHLRSASHSSCAPPSYNHPSGSHSSDGHLHPHLHRPIHLRPGISAPSLQDVGSSVSASSSFVDRRFAPSSLYLAPAPERESAQSAGAKWRLHLERMDPVQALFWLGFVAPWCWLIGGWVTGTKPPGGHPSSSACSDGYHGGGSSLPLWMSRSKSMQSFDTTKMNHGYPFVAPSASSLMPPPPPYQSRFGTVVLTPKPVGLQKRNPWVRRCRIAAVTSGVLIAVVFLVALVVAATSHAG